MNTTVIHECESVTRSIARWGSLAAAVIFGIAFLIDEHLSFDIVAGQVGQIALIVLIFAGYALAWTQRYEALGSIIALLATGMVYFVYATGSDWAPHPSFLVVGAPALIHLVAVAIHRFALPKANAGK